MKLLLNIPDKPQPDKAGRASPAFRQTGEQEWIQDNIGRSCVMRKQVLVILVLSLILIVTACGTSSGGGESEVGGNEKATFQATILEIHDGYYLVEPVAGSTELNSADQITVPMTNMNPSPEPEVGDVLEIEYDGSIAESYPAQITNVHSISVVE